MNPNKIFITILASLIAGLLIVLNSPSIQYTFKEKPKILNIKAFLANQTNSLAVKFSDLTLQSGLYFTHQQGDHKLTGINESLGSGACVLDYDNDGWQDLFIVNGSGQNRFYGKLHWWQQLNSHQLFKNTGDHNFINKTKDAGLSTPSWGMGCIATDFNNDGYSDLLITTIGNNQLFKNNGNGTFSKIKNFAIKSNPTWSTSACAADFDNDGLVDLYIANYINFDKTKLNYEGQSEFKSNLTEFFNPSLFNPALNRLYKNMGNFIFADLTDVSGLIDSSSRSLAVRCQDINSDFRPDIIIANEKGDGSNKLYINQGQFSFIDLSNQYQFQNNIGSHSINIGDINNDGMDELLLTTEKHQNIRLYQSQFSEKNTPVFTDIARSWGLTENISSFQSNWGGGLHDFNQDGLLDFFVVNGFLTPDPDTPRVAKGQPNQLWLNTGKQFRALNNLNPDLTHTLSEPSRSSVFADFDNDGDMDIYISNNNHLGQFLNNETSSGSHWLGVHLVDKATNKSLIGTTVLVTSNIGMQTRTISSGDSFLSDSDDRLLFGLKSDNHIKRLTVTWPNGKRHHFDNIAVNQYVKIDITHGVVPYNIEPEIKEEKPSLPTDEPNLATLFLSLITQLQGIESALPYLNTALSSQDISVRKSAINELGNHSNPKIYSLLINSIDDENDEVAALSLDKLCSFENESTIRWLVGALSDRRDIIRETAAHCFELLYREEEAMIHRKYLALPALIKLLTDENIRVQAVSARALAEAEHYRSVTPLITLLNSEKQKIRSEAARSLGLIREKNAIRPLLTRLQNANEVAEVFAHALIALKRLNYKEFSATFDSFFQARMPFNKTRLQTRVDTLLYFYNNTLESIYIHPQSVTNNAAMLISQNRLNHKIIIKLIPVIASTNSKQSNLLARLTKSSNQEIRLKSYVALLTNYPANRQTIMKQVAHDPSYGLQNKLLHILAEERITIPVESLHSFLLAQDTAKSTILLLGTIKNHKTATILSKILNSSPHQALIFQALENNPFSQQQIAEPFLMSTHSSIQLAAYSFYLNKFPHKKLLKKMPNIFDPLLNQKTKKIRNIAMIALSKREELWAIKKLQQVILDSSENNTLRLNLINNFKHPFQKKWTILLKIAKNTNDPIRYPVLELLSLVEAPKVIDFFKTLASNSNTKEKIKILALKMLAKNHPEWTLNFLINDPSQP